MQKPNVSDSRMAELQRREQQSLNRLQQLTELQTLQRYALRSLPEPGRSVEDLFADFLMALAACGWTTARLGTLDDLPKRGLRATEEELEEFHEKVKECGSTGRTFRQEVVAEVVDLEALPCRKGKAPLARWPCRLSRLVGRAGDNMDLRDRAERSERTRWTVMLKRISVESAYVRGNVEKAQDKLDEESIMEKVVEKLVAPNDVEVVEVEDGDEKDETASEPDRTPEGYKSRYFVSLVGRLGKDLPPEGTYHRVCKECFPRGVEGDSESRKRERVMAGAAVHFGGLLDIKEMPPHVQVALAAARVKTVGRFAALADDRGGIRDFCQRTLNIDPAAAGGDVNIAAVVDAWEVAKVRVDTRNKVEAEATKMEDRVTPAPRTLENLFDQIEQGKWRFMHLTEFVSREDADVAPVGAVIDHSTGRWARAKHAPEELRVRLDLVANAILMCAFRYGISADHDDKGRSMAQPSFELLSYEYQVRKAAIKKVNKGHSWVDSLDKAMVDTLVKDHRWLRLGKRGRGTFNVLYLFSGGERMASKAGYKVLLEEWDILRNPDHDLTDEGKRRGMIIVMRRMVAGDLGQSLRAQASARRNKAFCSPGRWRVGARNLFPDSAHFGEIREIIRKFFKDWLSQERGQETFWQMITGGLNYGSAVDNMEDIRRQVEEDLERGHVIRMDKQAARWSGRPSLLKYDVSRAHKLVPVKEQDSLEKPEEVFMHTVGAFGFGRILYWFFVMDVIEAPITWKKVAGGGGARLGWIGYEADIQRYLKGIGFQQVPMAVQIVLEFIKVEITRRPMTEPRPLPKKVDELFRVDAKAEGVVLLEADPEDTPEGEPFRVIASLELIEADALTNLDFTLFNPDLRVQLELGELGFKVIPKIMEAAMQLDAEIRLKKDKKKKVQEHSSKNAAKKPKKAEMSIQGLDLPEPQLRLESPCAAGLEQRRGLDMSAPFPGMVGPWDRDLQAPKMETEQASFVARAFILVRSLRSDAHSNEGAQAAALEEAFKAQQQLTAGHILRERFVLKEHLGSTPGYELRERDEGPGVPGLQFPDTGKMVKYAAYGTSHLGTGSFGDTWKAYDINLRKYVAVKIFYTRGGGMPRLGCEPPLDACVWRDGVMARWCDGVCVLV
ncbi:unnamed protein product [Effrenium voratum]|nr:unnamed protein product [Effrenium voratum]